jgi:hypothetical protein
MGAWRINNPSSTNRRLHARGGGFGAWGGGASTKEASDEGGRVEKSKIRRNKIKPYSFSIY